MRLEDLINQTLYGKKVVVAKSHPKMQLSDDCPVSDEFRKEFNMWLLEFFGFVCDVPQGCAYFDRHHVFMHPADYEILKQVKA